MQGDLVKNNSDTSIQASFCSLAGAMAAAIAALDLERKLHDWE